MTEKKFPIVGMGASAGGLEAIEEFLKHMPSDSDIAFILVTHLDPFHKSILPELLQKSTRMKVQQAKNGVRIEPNCLYVIPPNRDMAILHGKIHLIEPKEIHGLRLPINFFFHSLAHDRGKNAICVIFSGSGTDGTAGLKAIKSENGLVMVQEPSSAKHEGMPGSAIATGLADYVLLPGKMPEQLIQYIDHIVYRPNMKNVLTDEKNHDLLQKIFVLIRQETGHDFSSYKKNTICRRINKRMSIHRINNMPDYIRYLQENIPEIKILFKELLIGVTSFFRDREAYCVLKQTVIPRLLEDKPEGYSLRVWVPGCSSGEEAYSIAIILHELINEFKYHFTAQIFGTDIDRQAIERARTGFYPISISADVNSERLRQFFTKEGNAYRINKDIREMLIFAPQSILKDPPFTKLDLICCRNLMIYLNSESQKKLLSIFHYGLNKDGILFLGSSETIGGFIDLFSIVDKRWKIFKSKKSTSLAHRIANFPISSQNFFTNEVRLRERIKHDKGLKIPVMVEKKLMENCVPTCVVIDEKGNVIYVYGRTGRYLEHTTGETNLNISDLARDDLKLELTSIIHEVNKEKQEIVYENLKVKVDGSFHFFNLKAKLIVEPEVMQGMIMIFFEDAPAINQLESKGKKFDLAGEDKRRTKLEQELKYTKENLRKTIEELENSNEDLKSANEELHSTNEELQSTNEELDTSKEELQALNEELLTLNMELQGRIEELSRANDDTKNLLDNTKVATIFLDENMCIKRFTPEATKIISLIPSDIGRPLGHFVSNLKHEGLLENAVEVLKTQGFKEKEVKTKNKRWYFMRIIPYRTVTNKIDGIVIVFEDITKRKEAEEELLKLSRAVEQSPVSIMITNINGNIEYVNPKFIQITGYSSEEVMGKNPRFLKSEEKHSEFYKHLWETIKSNNIWRGEFHNKKKNGEYYWESASISPITNSDGVITHFVGIKEDITEYKQAEESLKLFRDLIDNSNDAIFVTDPKTGRYLDINKKACTDLNYTREELLSMKVEDIEIGKPEISQWGKYVKEIREKGSKIMKGTHKCKDGTTFPVEVSVKYISHENTDYLVNIVRSISKRNLPHSH